MKQSLSGSSGNPRGFTLLEMLVATAMVAVLAGSFYMTLSTAFRARASCIDAVEPLRGAQLALELIRADLRAALPPRGLLAGEFIGERQVGADGQDCDLLTFHAARGGGVDDDRSGDARRIEIVCEADPDGGGMTVVRRVTDNLLVTKTVDPIEEVLIRNVRRFSLRYFDGLDWLDGWDSTTLGDVLPLAVEVILEVDGPDPEEAESPGRRARLVVLLPCSTLQPGVSALELTE